jgi:hypothetical protein
MESYTERTTPSPLDTTRHPQTEATGTTTKQYFDTSEILKHKKNKETLISELCKSQGLIN